LCKKKGHFQKTSAKPWEHLAKLGKYRANLVELEDVLMGEDRDETCVCKTRLRRLPNNFLRCDNCQDPRIDQWGRVVCHQGHVLDLASDGGYWCLACAGPSRNLINQERSPHRIAPNPIESSTDTCDSCGETRWAHSPLRAEACEFVERGASRRKGAGGPPPEVLHPGNPVKSCTDTCDSCGKTRWWHRPLLGSVEACEFVETGASRRKDAGDPPPEGLHPGNPRCEKRGLEMQASGMTTGSFPVECIAGGHITTNLDVSETDGEDEEFEKVLEKAIGDLREGLNPKQFRLNPKQVQIAEDIAGILIIHEFSSSAAVTTAMMDKINSIVVRHREAGAEDQIDS
jgi:hypothetical protein